MMKLAAGVAVSAALLMADTEVKVKMQDLPAPVQKAARELLKSATLVGLNKEVEGGKTVYEVETKLNGRSRDVSLDSNGTVVEVEEETDISAIPAAARDALTRLAAGGKMGKVETVTAGSAVSYETVVTRAGRHKEVAVNADGSPHKE
jgi:hypothetical protein